MFLWDGAGGAVIGERGLTPRQHPQTILNGTIPRPQGLEFFLINDNILSFISNCNVHYTDTVPYLLNKLYVCDNMTE